MTHRSHYLFAFREGVGTVLGRPAVVSEAEASESGHVTILEPGVVQAEKTNWSNLFRDKFHVSVQPKEGDIEGSRERIVLAFV